jgi:hypothetical protein
MMARCSLMACHLDETMQMLDPIGIDRWPYELSLKYAFATRLTVRWAGAGWSPMVGTKLRSPHSAPIELSCSRPRALPPALEQLHRAIRACLKRTRITPRELAVLRLVSSGRQTAEIAKALELGEKPCAVT